MLDLTACLELTFEDIFVGLIGVSCIQADMGRPALNINLLKHYKFDAFSCLQSEERGGREEAQLEQLPNGNLGRQSVCLI